MNEKLQEFYESLDPNNEEDKKILDELESSKVNVPELDEMLKSTILEAFIEIRKLKECPKEKRKRGSFEWTVPRRSRRAAEN